MRFIRWLIPLILCAVAVPIQAGGLRVSLQLSDETAPYQDFAAALTEAFQSKKTDIEWVEAGKPSDLIVAVGVRAVSESLTAATAPVLGVMVPRQAYQSLYLGLPEARKRQTAAIFLDQPWERQLQHIRCVLPNARKIGLLYSVGGEVDLAAIRDSAGDASQVIAKPVGSASDIFPAMDKLLIDANVLLATPDNRIYNGGTIRNILLTSYRHRVPLIGFSAAYVNAGAVAAIYTTPIQMAQQTAAAIAYFEANRRLPDSRYPVEFETAQNQRVANSLGIVLASPQAIRACTAKSGGRNR